MRAVLRVTPTFCAAVGGFLVAASLVTAAGTGPECVASYIGDFPCLFRQAGVLLVASVVLCAVLTFAMRRHGLGRALAGSVLCPVLSVAVIDHLGNVVGPHGDLVAAVVAGVLVAGWDLVLPDVRPTSPE